MRVSSLSLYSRQNILKFRRLLTQKSVLLNLPEFSPPCCKDNHTCRLGALACASALFQMEKIIKKALIIMLNALQF